MRPRPALVATAALAAVLAAAAGAVPASGDTGRVLVVGDSLEVGTGPYLRGALGSVELDIDAKTSRTSTQGLAVLRRRLLPEYRAVVFDLGVNDGAAVRQLAANLVAARQVVDDRCLVVSTVHRPGASTVQANRAIRAFADADLHAVLVDWDAAADPALLSTDGVHAKPLGYKRRAQVVAEGVAACLAGGRAAPPQASAPPELEPHRPRRHARPAAPAIHWSALGLPWRSLVALAADALDVVRQLAETTLAGLRHERPEIVLGAAHECPRRCRGNPGVSSP
jgi:lysophospholipase L1-like esterase